MKQQPSGLVLMSPKQTGGFFPGEWIPAAVVGYVKVCLRGVCWHRSTEEMLVAKRVVL